MRASPPATPTLSTIALVSDNGALARPVSTPAWQAPWMASRILQVTRNRPVDLGRKAFHYLRMLSADRWVFVGGGASLFHQAQPRTSRLYKTTLHEKLEGPALDTVSFADWREVLCERRVNGGLPDQTYSVIERPA